MNVSLNKEVPSGYSVNFSSSNIQNAYMNEIWDIDSGK